MIASKAQKNSSTRHSRVRYSVMDENGILGGIKDPFLMDRTTAEAYFEDNLDDLGQNAQIVKVRVTYEVLDYDPEAFILPE